MELSFVTQERVPPVRMRRHGDVLVVALRGLYGLDTHRAMRSQVARELRVRPARAVVADLRHAVSVLSAHDRESIVMEAPCVRVPVAMVVCPMVFSDAVRQCSYAWSHGRIWVSFLDLEDALEWACHQRAPRV